MGRNSCFLFWVIVHYYSMAKREVCVGGNLISMFTIKETVLFCFAFGETQNCCYFLLLFRNMSGKEIVSLISSGEKSAIEEVSDSNSSTHASRRTARRFSNICASRFKGVVPHHNGNWGCQIYANHRRIWLGTFKSEKDAAMAYDSAAIKLRRGSGDCRRNFPFTDITVEEPIFQNNYSTEAVINMIKDGTYQSKFADFLGTRLQNVETELSLKLINTHSNRSLACKQLFKKALTPSDVGKLNRLVIPKKFATKFFSESAQGINKQDDEMLAFYDKNMKLWKFRYCYWRSSQSYVFTRGWNRFVEEKQLKANDTIVFSLCECWENSKISQIYQMIDVNNVGRSSNMGMELQLHLGQTAASESDYVKEDRFIEANPRRDDANRKSFKLFGAQII